MIVWCCLYIYFTYIHIAIYVPDIYVTYMYIYVTDIYMTYVFYAYHYYMSSTSFTFKIQICDIYLTIICPLYFTYNFDIYMSHIVFFVREITVFTYLTYVKHALMNVATWFMRLPCINCMFNTHFKKRLFYACCTFSCVLLPNFNLILTHIELFHREQ